MRRFGCTAVVSKCVQEAQSFGSLDGLLHVLRPLGVFYCKNKINGKVDAR